MVLSTGNINGSSLSNGVKGHAGASHGYNQITNGINNTHISNGGTPAPGLGRPNKFYPIDGKYPGTLSAEANEHSLLRIAIIGGGLGGAAAAGTLSHLPDVEVKVYERADKVREAGALIGVMVSAVRALSRMLSPAGWERLQYLLYRGESVEGINHRHWRTGEIMTNALSPHTPRHMQEGRIGRVALHDLLMREVPEEVMHYNHGVEKVEKRSNGDMRIHFEDGHTADADLVVAADGLYSRTRRSYLPDGEIRYRGRVSYRQNIPVELVSHIKDLPNDTSSWRRNGEVVFLSKLEPGVYSFVTMATETEEYAKTLQWQHSMGRVGIERLLEHFKDWDPRINEVIKCLPNVEAYPLQAAPWMRDLIRDDSVAFVGDAAHPTAGAYGAGCSFAFSDVRALYLSLWRSHTVQSELPYDVPYALHLFNETRRHFLHRVEEQIQMDKVDLLYIAEAVHDDNEYIRRYRERFTVNWWLLEHDVDARWQEVEAKERHTYKKQNAAKEIAEVASTVVGD